MRLNEYWRRLNRSGLLCYRWTGFAEFAVWSEANGYRPWRLLHRKDKSALYSPENCFWASSVPRGEPVVRCESYDKTVRMLGLYDALLAEITEDAKRAEVCLEALSESDFVDNKETALKLRKEVQLLMRRVSEIRLTALYDKEK